MGRSAPQLQPLDRRPAGTTGFTSAAIDPGLATVIAIQALQISKITKGRPPGTNAVLEHLDYAAVEDGDRRGLELVAAGFGVNFAQEQGFIGVDIADSGDQSLVQQGGFDNPLAALEPIGKVAQAELRFQGFRSEGLEGCDHRFGRPTGGHPPHLTKAAGIDESQLLTALDPESHPGVFGQGALGLDPEQLPGHAQMAAEVAAG